MGVTAAVAAAVGTTYAVYSGERNMSVQKDAMQKQERAAAKQADLADQANNKANRKMPSIQATAKANQAGAGSTMLTGPQGIDPGTLTLGRNTLLGA